MLEHLKLVINLVQRFVFFEILIDVKNSHHKSVSKISVSNPDYKIILKYISFDLKISENSE